jgi:hypothetical protein
MLDTTGLNAIAPNFRAPEKRNV